MHNTIKFLFCENAIRKYAAVKQNKAINSTESLIFGVPELFNCELVPRSSALRKRRNTQVSLEATCVARIVRVTVWWNESEAHL